MLFGLKKFFGGLKKKFYDLKNAYFFKEDEKNFEEFKFRVFEADYLRKSFELENFRNNFEEERGFFKKNIRSRYFSNIFRVVFGLGLIQDEEAMLGLKFVYDSGPGYVVVDNDKYYSALNDLESRVSSDYFYNYNGVNNKRDGESSNHNVYGKGDVKKSVNNKNDDLNGSVRSSSYIVKNVKASSNEVILNNQSNQYNQNCLNNVSALYIDSFRGDCFTNSLASISTSSYGSVKVVADSLAGYVLVNDKTVAPVKRSWSKRLNDLEFLINNNSFSSSDKDYLAKIKTALSSNKYLTSKKSEIYKKAVALLDSIIKGDDVVKN